jgi:hypothetical protein
MKFIITLFLFAVALPFFTVVSYVLLGFVERIADRVRAMFEIPASTDARRILAEQERSSRADHPTAHPLGRALRIVKGVDE